MSLVSVIIPAHNYGKYIAATLDSLLAQTYTNWRCFIIDDGSVDNTGDIAKEYSARDNRFHYTYQSCQGVSAARNVGLRFVTSGYVQFLDADDLLLPGKIEHHVAFLEQTPTVDIVYSDVRYFANDDLQHLSLSLDMQNRDWMPKATSPKSAISFLAQENLMPIQAPLSRAAIIQKVGFFETEVRHCEDWDFWFRCAAAGGEIRFIDSAPAISYIRVHQASATNNKAAMYNGVQFVKSKVYAFIEENPTAIEHSVRTKISRLRALDLVKSKQKIKGVMLFLRTIGQPTNGDVSFKDILYWLRK